MDDYKGIVHGLNGFLYGPVSPAISGDTVCWFEGWDDSSTGKIYMTNIKDKSKKYDLPEYVDSLLYAFDEYNLYYISEYNELIKHDTQTGNSEIFATTCQPVFLKLIDENLYADLHISITSMLYHQRSKRKHYLQSLMMIVRG